MDITGIVCLGLAMVVGPLLFIGIINLLAKARKKKSGD